MLDANQLKRRLQLNLIRLRQPSSKPTVPSAKTKQSPARSTRFRVHGWRWHHLGIIRDLTRLHMRGTHRASALCDASGRPEIAAAQRAAFQKALLYILRDNWGLHNSVEERFFLPWVQKAAAAAVTAAAKDVAATPGQGDVTASVRVISGERARLARESDHLARMVDKWAKTDSLPTCRRDLRQILGIITKLRKDATRLFDVSEAVLIPRVLQSFTEKEQLQFNHSVLNCISGKEARVSLVIFRDAVDRSHAVVASPTDWTDFQASVPAPIRNLALPYWRNKFVRDKAKFLAE